MISDLLCAADPVRFARLRLDFSPDPIQAASSPPAALGIALADDSDPV